MKVILADTLGFCGGVRKAVDLIYSNINKFGGSNVIMNGPIIHNDTVIADLNNKGVKLLDDDGSIKGKKVVVRAHGVTPLEEQSIIDRGGEVIDGTCPIVKSSQKKIHEHYLDGYFIVITGDRGHAEVIGLVGQAPNNSMVAGSVSDLEGYTFPEKTLLISQTTFSKPEFFKIESCLKRICPTLKSLCTICGATKKRQDAVIKLAELVDCIVVVGSIASSNTKRLKKSCEEIVPTWLIESEKDIPASIIKFNSVGVSAGASTPDDVIQSVVDRLKSL